MSASGKERMSNNIARIENTFVEQAQYNLGVREQKLMLYLIANTNPYSERFIEQIIPVKELEAVLKSDNKKWGGIYKEIEDFCATVITRTISFPTDVLLDGKPLSGHISWFQSIKPLYDKRGNLCVRFLFAEELEPFLLRLKEYAQLDRMEVAFMRSRHAIRLFQIFKALRTKHRKHKNISTTSYSLEELKKLLGLYNPQKKHYKYPSIKDFKRRVLDPAIKEINELTSLYVEYYPLKSGRTITDIRFNIYEREENIAQLDDEKRILHLRRILGKANSWESVNLKLFQSTFPKEYVRFEKEAATEVEAMRDAVGETLRDEPKLLISGLRNRCLEFIRKQLEITI